MDVDKEHRFFLIFQAKHLVKCHAPMQCIERKIGSRGKQRSVQIYATQLGDFPTMSNKLWLLVVSSRNKEAKETAATE